MFDKVDCTHFGTLSDVLKDLPGVKHEPRLDVAIDANSQALRDARAHHRQLRLRCSRLGPEARRMMDAKQVPEMSGPARRKCIRLECATFSDTHPIKCTLCFAPYCSDACVTADRSHDVFCPFYIKLTRTRMVMLNGEVVSAGRAVLILVH
jgi:hypothetical protein